MDDTNVSFRHSLKQFSKPGTSRENTSVSRQSSASNRRSQSALTPKRPDTTSLRRQQSALTSQRPNSTLLRRQQSSLSAVSTTSSNHGVRITLSTPDSVSKPRAKTSVGPARRNDTLSEMFQQQTLINVKGRPVSAPLSEASAVIVQQPLQQHGGGIASNKTASRNASKLKVDIKRNGSARKQKAAPSLPVPKQQIKSSMTLKSDTPNSNGAAAEVETKQPNETVRSLRSNEISKLKQSKTPFWFYRSKAEFLLQTANDDDTDDVKEDNNKSPLGTPRSARSNGSADSPRIAVKSDDVKNNATPVTSPEQEIVKPETLKAQIYVYDSYQRRYVPCTPPQTPRQIKDSDDKLKPHTTSASVEEAKEDVGEEVVDLLRRNHRPDSHTARMRQVMRSLPLQSDLDKYVWWLDTKKNRDGRFTKSMNRYVPGFFHIEEDGAKSTSSSQARGNKSRDTTAARARASAVSEPVPAKSTFITDHVPTAGDVARVTSQDDVSVKTSSNEATSLSSLIRSPRAPHGKAVNVNG